jgi:hypothetical protein
MSLTYVIVDVFTETPLLPQTRGRRATASLIRTRAEVPATCTASPQSWSHTSAACSRPTSRVALDSRAHS